MHSSHMSDQEGGAMGSSGESASAMGDKRLSSPNNNKQWVVRTGSVSVDTTTDRKTKDATYPSLIIGSDQATNFRYPWEGFPDVGFRCVMSVPK